MKKFVFFSSFFALMLVSCEPSFIFDDCFSFDKNATLTIKLIDKNTGENLIENGTYNFFDIKLYSVKSNSFFEKQILDIDNPANKLQFNIRDINVGESSKEYRFTLSPEDTRDMIFHQEWRGEGCSQEKIIIEGSIEGTETSSGTDVYDIEVRL